jgi:hypothetical protein
MVIILIYSIFCVIFITCSLKYCSLLKGSYCMTIRRVHRSFSGRQQLNEGRVTRFGKCYLARLIILGSIKTWVGKYLPSCLLHRQLKITICFFLNISFLILCWKARLLSPWQSLIYYLFLCDF